MSKYAIAAMSFYENDLKVDVVEAASELEALYAAILLIMEVMDEEFKEYIKDMNAEELKQEAYNGDCVIQATLIENY